MIPTTTEGAVLSMVSKSDIDGRWPQISINFNLDNGTLRRTFKSPSQAGGRIIYGFYNRPLPYTRMEVNLTNGGLIESYGKMVFGHAEFFPESGHNRGIEVAMTLNDGALDLTGGADYSDFFGVMNGELVFFYEYEQGVGPKNEKYSINFNGSGSITVDNGIFAAAQDMNGDFMVLGGAPDFYTLITYEALWDLGILQANGLSGLTGSTFGNYFTTSGSAGSPNYTLTSLVVSGDYNLDGSIDAADHVALRKNAALYGGVYGNNPASYNEWRQHFGQPGLPSAGGGAAAPEPTVLPMAAIATAALICRRSR